MIHTPPSSSRATPFLTDETLERALTAIETPEGIQASTQRRYSGAIFGRDSLEVGLDIVEHLPALAARIILSVARHIGLEHNELTEEEPGKGFHEYRNLIMGGQEVGEEQKGILRRLSSIWGGDGKSMTYYGAADTGALYLILLDRYCLTNGMAILDDEIVHQRTGRHVSIKQTVEMTAEYYCRKIDESDIGFMEFRRTNDDGLWFQIMRDWFDSMVLSDGTIANADAPIAAIEIQSLTHAALRSASRLTSDMGQKRRWSEAAETLRANVLEKMWMPDTSYFARAIHRPADAFGQPALITTIDSPAAELLRDELFDDLTETERARYIGGIVRMIYSDLFLTDIGFRMQPTTLLPSFDYWAYQGPNSVWPTVTKRIADGLHRQGMYRLGFDIDERLMRSCEIARDFPEYFYVTDLGTPIYRFIEHETDIVLDAQPAPHMPVTIQAWTASAVFSSIRRTIPDQTEGDWQASLSDEIIDGLWKQFSVTLDLDEGKRRQQRWIQSNSATVPAMIVNPPH